MGITRTSWGATRGIFWLSDHPIDEDRLLIARVASGDRKGLEEIYARFGGALFRYLLTLAPDRQLAEEILQDTLVAVWRGAGTYAGRSRVRTWLFGVARRQAYNTLRKRSLPLAGEGELAVFPDVDPEPEHALLEKARQEELMVFIRRLTPLHREVLALIFFHELSYEETAEVLEVPVGTVKSRLSNAKKALRKLLQTSDEVEK